MKSRGGGAGWGLSVKVGPGGEAGTFRGPGVSRRARETTHKENEDQDGASLSRVGRLTRGSRVNVGIGSPPPLHTE